MADELGAVGDGLAVDRQQAIAHLQAARAPALPTGASCTRVLAFHVARSKPRPGNNLPGSVMGRRSSPTRNVSERSAPSRRTRRGITPSSVNWRISAICKLFGVPDAAVADAHDLIAALQPGHGGGLSSRTCPTRV